MEGNETVREYSEIESAIKNIKEKDADAPRFTVARTSRRNKIRRKTNIFPNFTREDIAKHPVTQKMPDEKFKPSRDYHFRCGGEVQKEGSSFDKKHIEWQATFPRPLEELIYPSLQCFDMDLYSKQQETQRLLHGNYSSKIPLVLIRDTATRQEAPKWTARITEPAQQNLSKKSILDEIELNGEIQLRKEMKDRYKAGDSNSRPHSSSHPHGLRDPNHRKSSTFLKSSTLFANDKAGQELYSQLKKDSSEFLDEKVPPPPVVWNPDDLELDPSLQPPAPVAPSEQSVVRNKEYEQRQKTRVRLSSHLGEVERLMGEEGVGGRRCEEINGILAYRLAHEQKQEEKEEELRVGFLPFSSKNRTNTRRASGIVTKLSRAGSQSMDASLSRLQQKRKEEEAESRARALFDSTRLTRMSAALEHGLQPHTLNSSFLPLSPPPSPKSHTPKSLTPTKYLSPKSSFSTSYSIFNKSLATSKLPSKELQQAQDALTLAQLQAGLIPENFFGSRRQGPTAADKDDTLLDLNNFSIGDEQGICLSKGLQEIPSIQTVGLKDNRLSSVSLPGILGGLTGSALLHLDLSWNDLRGLASIALSQFLRSPNQLQFLDISRCQLGSEEFEVVCTALRDSVEGVGNRKGEGAIGGGHLRSLLASDNSVCWDGLGAFSAFIASPLCGLKEVDLAWNDLGPRGAAVLAQGLALNLSISSVKLKANTLGDEGGQRIAASLASNRTLEELHLGDNNIADCACFVFSKVLKGHPRMRTLKLNNNPLGDAGARSLFRTILKGLACFVHMRKCDFPINVAIYNHTYPALSYELDLSRPYEAAILSELTQLVAENPTTSSLSNFQYRENPKTQPTSVSLTVSAEGQLVSKSSGQKWPIPSSGLLSLNYAYAISVPSLSRAISKKSLHILGLIVANGRSEADSRNWLRLLCADILVTTDQVDELISFFEKQKVNVIAEGILSKLEIITIIWSKLLDTQNVFDFLSRHLDERARKDLIYALTFERFKFNWVNPTAHWRLDLGVRAERSLMMQLIALNTCESDYSRWTKMRGDTSQYGNYNNFRNVKFHSQDFQLDNEFLASLPHSGTLEFDYVSTTRPSNHLTVRRALARQEKAEAKGEDGDGEGDRDADGEGEEKKVVSRPRVSLPKLGVSGGGGGNSKLFGLGMGNDSLLEEDEDDDDEDDDVEDGGGRTQSASSGLPSLLKELRIDQQAAANPSQNPAPPRPEQGKGLGLRGQLFFNYIQTFHDGSATLIPDDDLFPLLKTLGLSMRHRAEKSAAIFALLELQLASTKFLFSTRHVIQVLDTFSAEPRTQAKVVVCLYSRILDLHNFDQVLRYLSSTAQREVLDRVGVLNCINPLKPSLDYNLTLLHYDNRLLVFTFMELSSLESGDQIKEDPRNQLSFIFLYGISSRLVKEPRPETMIFGFCDFGERSQVVCWPERISRLNRFLVAEDRADPTFFLCRRQFMEMEKAGALTKGPIDLQYEKFQERQQKVHRKGPKSNDPAGIGTKSQKGREALPNLSETMTDTNK